MRIETIKKRINAAISKRSVIELIYRLDNGDEWYFAVAPICIEEHDGKCYLLSLDRDDDGYAFDVAKIISLSEYWADFSLCKEFSLKSFKDTLFNKGNHINGYIMVTNEKKNEINPEKLRKELQTIESDIKDIVGPRKENFWVDIPANIDRENLGNLLRSRRYCLNMLFRKDQKELEHFKKVNDMLRVLTDRMYKKSARIYRQYLISGIDKAFDDDFMINADLRFSYNGEESIVKLGDEEYYGSDFHYMINIICDLCADKPFVGASLTKGFRKSDKPEMSDKELELDNEMDRFCWGELKLSIPELEEIEICCAVNEICVYDNGYSVPDLLRMNDFWCEVKAVYQHIRGQNGKILLSEH